MFKILLTPKLCQLELWMLAWWILTASRFHSVFFMYSFVSQNKTWCIQCSPRMRRCDPASEKNNLCPIINGMIRSAALASFSAYLHNVHRYVLAGSFSRFITEDFHTINWLYKSSLLYRHHYFSTRSVLQARVEHIGSVHLRNDVNEGERRERWKKKLQMFLC